MHRFAIEYHRKLRGKNVSRSLLDEIDGIGPVRRKSLLETFGSIDAIKQLALSDDPADLQALIDAPGMDKRAAENVRQFFAKR